MGLSPKEMAFCPIHSGSNKDYRGKHYVTAFAYINSSNMTILCGRYYYNFYFTDEDIEPYSLKIACSSLYGK